MYPVISIYTKLWTVTRILNTLHVHNPPNRIYSLYHQHNPSFCFDKHLTSSSSSLGKIQASLILLSLVRRFGKATDNSINLFGCNRLAILTDMQLLAVNHFRNLFSSHPSVMTCEAVKYGFFDFHILLDNISFL